MDEWTAANVSFVAEVDPVTSALEEETPACGALAGSRARSSKPDRPCESRKWPALVDTLETKAGTRNPAGFRRELGVLAATRANANADAVAQRLQVRQAFGTLFPRQHCAAARPVRELLIRPERAVGASQLARADQRLNAACKLRAQEKVACRRVANARLRKRAQEGREVVVRIRESRDQWIEPNGCMDAEPHKRLDCRHTHVRRGRAGLEAAPQAPIECRDADLREYPLGVGSKKSEERLRDEALRQECDFDSRSKEHSHRAQRYVLDLRQVLKSIA